MSTRTKLLTFIAALLILLLIILAIYFYLLTRPLNQTEAPPVSSGMKYLFSIYGVNKNDNLLEPNDVAFDKEGNIYIADTGKNRILKFNSSGNFLQKFETKNMNVPLGVDVAPDGSVYATSNQASKMFVFKPNGILKKEKPMDRPISIEIYKQKVYVTSQSRVWVYDLNLKELQHWGKPGRRAGEFEYPNGVAVDNKDSVYVSDSMNTRIQVFNKKGEPDTSRTIGRVANGMNDKNRPLSLPLGLTLGPNGYLYLVDSFDFNIKVFNKYGKQLAKLGDMGSSPGYFSYPAGIAYNADSNNRFAVADKYNNRVQVVEITVK